MEFCKDAMKVCKYASMLVANYAQMQVCKYASMQVCKYASMQVCKYASIQVCKYINMQLYQWASMKPTYTIVLWKCIWRLSVIMQSITNYADHKSLWKYAIMHLYYYAII